MSGQPNQRPAIRTVADGWLLYEALMRRKGASEKEIFNFKAAFYTGATVVLDVMTGISAQNVPDDIGVTVLDGLHREVRAFTADMLSSLATSMRQGR